MKKIFLLLALCVTMYACGAETLVPRLPVTAGLTLWLKADAIPAGTTAVAVWPDSSGLHADAVQMVKTKQPILIPNAVKTLPLVRFDGDDDCIEFRATIAKARTIFWVVSESPDADPGYKSLLGHAVQYDFSRGANKEFWTTGITSENVTNGVTRVNGKVIDGTTTAVPTTLAVVALRTSGPVAASMFGSDRNAPGRNWEGKLGELLIFDTTLTDTQIDTVEQYLLAKWGIVQPESAQQGQQTETEKNPIAKQAQCIANLQAGKKQVIVAYGTSLTASGAWVQQLGSRLSAKYPNLVTVQNSGFGGSSSNWGVQNLDNMVIGLNPDTVLIEFAINDAFLPYGITRGTCRQNLKDMIDRIQRANPACEVILLTMDAPIHEHLTNRPQIESYYQAYREVATARNLRLIDLYPRWKAILTNAPVLYDACVPDGIHPNAFGCETVITPWILAALTGQD